MIYLMKCDVIVAALKADLTPSARPLGVTVTVSAATLSNNSENVNS